MVATMTGELPRHALGRTGLHVTALCAGGSVLGSMPSVFGYDLPADRAIATLREIFRGPVNFLDTASGYSDGESERRIGLALKEIGGVPDGFVIASKADRDPHTNDFSGDQVRRCLERSLTLLGVDHIPVYYLHDPEHVGFETTMARGGAVEALAALKSEGVIGYVGVAAGPVGLLTRYIRTGAFDVVLTHNRYTLVDDSANGVLDLATELGLGVVNAAPFGGGILAKGAAHQTTYAYRPAPRAVLDRIGQMEAICAHAGVDLAAAALQFSTGDERVDSTVVSLSSPERVRAVIDLACTPVPEMVMQQLSAT
jgi:D-threo-aldose 1-dehydrogenase